MHRKRLPRGVVEPPTLEVSKKYLVVVVKIWMISKVFSKLNDSMNRKLEFVSNSYSAVYFCAMGKVKGMDRLTENRRISRRSQKNED